MSKNDTSRDTSKSIDRLSSFSSHTSEKAFDYLDKGAKKASDFKEYLHTKNQEEENENTKNDNENQEQNQSDNTEYQSRLKTNEEQDESVSSNSEESSSRIKTNVNNDSKESNVEAAQVEEHQSRIKTMVTNKVNKTFGFKENQGKISKMVTVASKTGKGISKVSRVVTKASRELDKAMSQDGTGKDYLQAKIGRKTKKTASKFGKKQIKKVNKKVTKPLLKQLVKITKTVIVKLLKMLISLLGMLAEVIIPLALVIIIIGSVCSIFGSSGSDNLIPDYKSYMSSIQQSYDADVDKFMRENPKGVVVGVRGSYGEIDWRIPLSIFQGTNAYLEYDQAEKDLLKRFNDAGLFEKHEIVEQIVYDKDESGNTVENTTKVMIITNGTYEDYMSWCRDNFSVISDFNKKKSVFTTTQTYFTSEQLEIINLLYQSDDFAELLGSDFKSKKPIFGTVDKEINLDSEFYNSRNVLTTSGYKGQCTWFAYGRALEVSNLSMPTTDAQTWLTKAITMGYKTGTQPSTYSVVVLMGRKHGHVAFVESYDGQKITISEGNTSNPCSDGSCSQVEYAKNHANEMVKVRTYNSYADYYNANKRSGLSVIGFIYLK